MKDEFEFKADIIKVDEDTFADHVLNRYLPLLMIVMAALVIGFLLNIPTEMVL